jgi:hypothetical protein
VRVQKDFLDRFMRKEKIPDFINVGVSSLLMIMMSEWVKTVFSADIGDAVTLYQKIAAGGAGLGTAFLLLHGLYRLATKHTRKINDQVFLTNMRTFLKTYPIEAVPAALKNWFNFYSNLEPEIFEQRIFRGAFLNDLGIALCAASLTF